MQSQTLQQLQSFAIFILIGFLIGLLFDMFRVSRRIIKTSNIATYIEDIAFWLFAGILVLFALFKFSSGNIRIYTVLGLIIGAALYMLIFSKIVINTLVKAITVINKVFHYVLNIFLYPINLIKKIIKFILEPVEEFRNNMTNKLKKVINLKKIKNKSKNRKDFA